MNPASYTDSPVDMSISSISSRSAAGMHVINRALLQWQLSTLLDALNVSHQAVSSSIPCVAGKDVLHSKCMTCLQIKLHAILLGNMYGCSGAGGMEGFSAAVPAQGPCSTAACHGRNHGALLCLGIRSDFLQAVTYLAKTDGTRPRWMSSH